MKRLLLLAVILLAFGCGMVMGPVWQTPSQAGGCTASIRGCAVNAVMVDLTVPVEVAYIKKARANEMSDSDNKIALTVSYNQ